MKASELIAVLDEQDTQNKLWLFSTSMLRVLFPKESENSLKASLRRHVENGILRPVRKGLYANERARSAPARRLEAIVAYLKPNDFNYLSQESRLSDLGVISQMPLNHLTVMTTGTSQTFKTAYGTVEFTHTKQPMPFLMAHTSPDPDGLLRVADEILALRDLRHAKRNLGMVEAAQ